MVVQHNMQAMNANRMLGITTGQQAKSTEKLSSGYKINRAADNAAGLAISEKMRKQIRGLDQASANAQDGISAVQTAEGALNEVQDMLQRMNELAVQSANGTNSISDRQSIQDEIDQLTTEIDRVSETTKFNEAYLLRGDNTVPKKFNFAYGPVGPAPEDPAEEDADPGAGRVATATFSQVGEDAEANEDGTYPGADPATGLRIQVTFATRIDQESGEAAEEQGSVASAADQNALAKAMRDQGVTLTKELIQNVKYDPNNEESEEPEAIVKYSLSLNGEVARNYSINVVDSGSGEGSIATFEISDAAGKLIATVRATGGTLVAPAADDSEPEEGTIAGEAGDKQTATLIASAITSAADEGDRVQYYDKDGNAVSANALKDYFTSKWGAANADGEYSEDVVGIMAKGGVQLYDAVGNAIDMETAASNLKIVASDNLVGDLKLKLHVGADATRNNQITINLQAMSAKGLGVNGLKVNGNDDSNALNAIETIKAALATVSAQRSELGAVQNRLEHTIANLDNIVENTTSAESAIRDTDMAEEMVKYSKSNILAQAGQSMLAQANQSNQGVLSLLG